MSQEEYRISGRTAEGLTPEARQETGQKVLHDGIGLPWRPVEGVPPDDSFNIFNPDSVAQGSFMTFMPNGWEQGKWYPSGAVVTNGTWTMVANTLNLENPIPVPGDDANFGLPAYAPATQSENAVVYSGHLYTFNEPCWIRTLQVYVTQLTVDTNYRIIAIYRKPGQNEVTTVFEEPVLTENGWRAIASLNALVPSGTEMLVYIDALNSGSSNQVTGGWSFSGQDNVAAPPRGGWNHNNSNTILRIDKFDLDGTDRTSELGGITANSTVQFVNTDNPAQTDVYRVRNIPVDQGTYWQYDVTLENQTGGGVPTGTTTMTADVPIPQPTEYAEQVGSVPSYTQNVDVEGFLQFNGVDQGGAANSYGIDIEIESVIASEFWDVLAYNG